MSTPPPIQQFDEDRASLYDDRIRQVAPGYDVLHEVLVSTMQTALGSDAHVLVVGAGTGTEIVAMGRQEPGWRFTAVDPSEEMLATCQRRLANTDLEERVEYVPEPIEEFSSPHRYDGATSVFVSHFLPDRGAKLQFFKAIAHYLSPGAPFAFADLHAAPSTTSHETLWRAWKQWVTNAGTIEKPESTFSRIDEELSFVREEELADLLREARFSALVPFYRCLLWGGWWTRRSKKRDGMHP